MNAYVIFALIIYLLFLVPLVFFVIRSFNVKSLSSDELSNCHCHILSCASESTKSKNSLLLDLQLHTFTLDIEAGINCN